MNSQTKINPNVLALVLVFITGPLLTAIELLPAGSPIQADLHLQLDNELYVSGTPNPGLLFSNEEAFFNPRATLFLDTHFGRHLHGFVQARFDRGFDPGLVPDGSARLDEYLVKWTPFAEPVINIQAGKFATAFGAWVPRHLSWDNPFITAPAAYENVLGISDRSTAPTLPAFLKRKTVADKKRDWVPLIWGPSYAHGASVFGRVEKFDYAFEIKSAAISSRPSAWGANQVNWDEPTYTGRLGYRPEAAWNLGASFSSGTYLQDDAAASLPAGTGRGDFKQRTIGLDASYAHHHFELWSELILSRFEVPHVGDAETLAYFIEAKYKFNESLFCALRWNQMFFNDVSNGSGGSVVWDRDLSRVDAALGYRFNRHLQTKLQYSYGHEGGPNANANHLLAVQMTLKF